MGVVGKVAPLIRSSGFMQPMHFPQLSVCWQMTTTQTPMMDTTITAMMVTTTTAVATTTTRRRYQLQFYLLWNAHVLNHISGWRVPSGPLRGMWWFHVEYEGWLCYIRWQKEKWLLYDFCPELTTNLVRFIICHWHSFNYHLTTYCLLSGDEEE